MLIFLHPPWLLMWLLALTFYALAKTATLALSGRREAPLFRKLSYLLLFPGMNATSFCASTPAPARHPTPVPFALNALAGIVLLWAVARVVPPHHPLIQGWIGMIGILLILHFGLLQLAALAWQAKGVNAPLLMNQPLRSASVTEFWSLRWNSAFRQLSHQFLFKPLVRRTSLAIAILLTFAVSGLIHDLIISVPAGGGYGLPTAYFLLQGAALLFERSIAGKRLRHQPVAARCFAYAVIALPAPLLFHPPFVTRVILPFMTAIGALPRS